LTDFSFVLKRDRVVIGSQASPGGLGAEAPQVASFGPAAEMKVAGRERCHEEATRTAPEPAEPHGPRRCGGPEHSAGLSIW